MGPRGQKGMPGINGRPGVPGFRGDVGQTGHAGLQGMEGTSDGWLWMRGSVFKNEPVILINNIFVKVSHAYIIKTLRRLRTVFEAQLYDHQ